MTGRSAFPGFSFHNGAIWLNTAHQGALPLAAAGEAVEAVRWKTEPFELTQARFDGVPKRLRQALARLVGVEAHEIVLANSASYGLNLIAQGFPWQEGDEVIVTAGDFPSNILPWLAAEKRYGIRVRQVQPLRCVLTTAELAAAITPRTRLFCATWVHSFSGFVSDIEALGALCRERGVVFILNASQGLGARPLNLSTSPVDALTCVGFKWLCGPYGTGFCWFDPALIERLRPVKAYWLAAQTAEDLTRPRDPVVRDDLGARGLDIFGTANFFNFVPFAAALEYLHQIGLDAIAAHDQALVDEFIDGLDPKSYRVLSPQNNAADRSTLVFFTHQERSRNEHLHQLLGRRGIYLAHRAGALRLSPHLYNSSADIARTIEVLNEHR